MKSKEIKLYNLPAENIFTARINARPNYLFFIVILLGLFSFTLNISRMYAIGLIVIGILCLLFMPRVPMIEFYKEYVVLHNKVDRNTCMMIYYEDIKGWYYSWTAKKDFLIIELNDDSVVKMEAFSKQLFEKYMNIFLKDKHINKMNNENSRS